MKIVGTATAVAGTALATTPAAAQMPRAGQFKDVKALAFDAYGTLFDVFSVTALCEQLFPGKGTPGIVVGFGGKQILLEDPDGNPIELFEPPRK